MKQSPRKTTRFQRRPTASSSKPARLGVVAGAHPVGHTAKAADRGSIPQPPLQMGTAWIVPARPGGSHFEDHLANLLVDIRFACGDNGKRMQPELVEYIRNQRRALEMISRLPLGTPVIEATQIAMKAMNDLEF